MATAYGERVSRPTTPHLLLVLSMVILAALLGAPAIGTSSAQALDTNVVIPSSAVGRAAVSHSVSYDRYSLIIDGRRVVLFGGEYQFWRTPSPSRWPVVLREMRAAGLNTVTVGVSWQFHSPAPGRYDFSGIRDLGHFLDDAAAAGLYVVARPGPAYNAESSASGMPGWLLAHHGGLRANSGRGYCGDAGTSSAYTAAYHDWYRHVLPIIARRQVTRGGGTVVLVQIENEYSPRCGSASYMTDLHDLARQEGISVPLLANNNSCCVAPNAWHQAANDGQPIVDIPAADTYPCNDTCSPRWNRSILGHLDRTERSLRASSHANVPVAIAELQGGYYTGWGKKGYGALAHIFTPAFAETLDGSALGQGATLVSIYMVAGGTSWGYLGGPDTETSYDYDAAINEEGTPGRTYGALKRTGMFVDAFGDLLGATTPTGSIASSAPDLLYADRRTVDGGQRGAQLIVLRNTSPTRSFSTRLTIPSTGPSVTTAPVTLPPHSLDLLIAHYHLGPFQLLYSTSRPLTRARIGRQEVVVLYGVSGTAGQTALQFSRAPRIVHRDRGIRTRYEPRSRLLIVDYIHRAGVRTLAVQSGRHRLVLLLTDPTGAAKMWRIAGSAGTLLITGPEMVTGTVIGPSRARVTAQVRRPTTVRTWSSAGIQARRIGLSNPRVSLPPLLSWRFMTESPERGVQFNDSSWVWPTETATSNPNVPSSDTLLADDYGFHYGFTWYRGQFIGTGEEKAIRLMARNSYSVWINGHYLGSSMRHNDLKNIDDQLVVRRPNGGNGNYADQLTFSIPSQDLLVGAQNIIAVLTESLGHNIGFSNGQLSRSPSGILSAELVGPRTPSPIVWRLQGGPVGEGDPSAPLNVSGLYGERNGWYSAGFDDKGWSTVRVPDNWSARGLNLQGVGWYRTTFSLALPPHVEAPIGLTIPRAEDKAMIWLNGLLIGRYWNGVGPQHSFYLPAGLLNEHGSNTLAIAVWNRGERGGLTGGVQLHTYSVSSSLTLTVGR